MYYKNVLLFGGGLDSAALFLYLVRKNIPFKAVFVDYGQVAAEAEYRAVLQFCRSYSIEVEYMYDAAIRKFNPQGNKMFGTGDNPFIDGRNLALIFRVAKALPKNIYIGFFDKNDPVTDAGEDFLNTVNHLLKLSFFSPDKSMQVHAPLIGVPKIEAVREALEMEPRFLDWTMTCWEPVNGQECGVCKHCMRKTAIKAQLDA